MVTETFWQSHCSKTESCCIYGCTLLEFFLLDVGDGVGKQTKSSWRSFIKLGDHDFVDWFINLCQNWHVLAAPVFWTLFSRHFCRNHGHFRKLSSNKTIHKCKSWINEFLSGHLCHISAHFYKWPLIFFCATENKGALMEVATYFFKWPLNFKLRDAIVQPALCHTIMRMAHYEFFSVNYSLPDRFCKILDF